MRYRHNDDYPVIHAISQAIRKTVEQAAAQARVDLLVELGERDDQVRCPVELIKKTVAEPDNLGFVPRECFVKLQLRRRE